MPPAALRSLVPEAQWERATDWVNSGYLRLLRRSAPGAAEERAYLVNLPGRREAIEVVIWPKEQDHSCSCGVESACAHAVAAWLADERGGVATAAPARIRYTIRRSPSGLILDREVPDPVVRAEGDQVLARLLAGWWGRPGLQKELLVPILAALEGLPTTLDGQPVFPTGAPVYGRVLVEDDGAGWRARLVRAAGIDEVFSNGAVRLADRLRPIGKEKLDERLRQQLLAGLRFRADEAERLVTRFIPELRALLDVEVRSTRLPEVLREPPRVELGVELQGDVLRVTPTLVYGDPPFARVVRGELLAAGRRIPVRDLGAERLLQSELGAMGPLSLDLTVERQGEAMLALLDSCSGWVRRELQRKLPSLHRERDAFEPLLQIADAAGGFSLKVEAGGVRPELLLGAWERGARYVQMMDGGWRPVPREWLERHGAVLAELLAAADSKGQIPSSAAPLVAEALASLDRPLPPSLDGLRALAGDFSAVPTVSLPPGFLASLRPYQQRGVDWLVWLRGAGFGGVLADDMGLGKTVQLLAALWATWTPGRRSLVVAPTSVLRNWEAEAARFVPGLSVNVYHGPDRRLAPADLTLCTYGLLRLDHVELASVEWDVVVLDEAQAIKNPESQVAQAAFGLSASQRLALSGTPMENKLDELWSVLHFVNPGMLGGRRSFRDRFELPMLSGSQRAAESLRKRIRPFVLRRLKREVAPDLPSRTEMILRCTLSTEERELYRTVSTLSRADVSGMLAGGKTLQVLEVLLRMRQAACHAGLLGAPWAKSSAKIELLMETLEEVLGENEGHRALIFSQWTSLLDRVEPALNERKIGFLRLDGSTRDRADVVRRFMAPDGPPVFLLSLKAGGTGLNLTAADYVFLLDPWWNPAAEDQATDRAHRIGQERPVVSCRIVAEGTVEEKILELQAQKRALTSAALDEEALAARLSRDDLLALFE